MRGHFLLLLIFNADDPQRPGPTQIQIERLQAVQ